MNRLRLGKRRLPNEAVQDLIEYALIAAFIGLMAILSLKSLGGQISNEFNSISSSI
jgi:hypothetical protein